MDLYMIVIKLLAIAFVIGIVALPIVIIMKMVRRPKPLFCAMCGTEGRPRRQTRGSFLIEIVLWLLFIIPGLIYSLWRVSTRRSVCAACGSDNVMPLDSPVARKLRAEFHPLKA